MNLSECQNSLTQAVINQPQYRDNISVLTNIAWGDQKADCRTVFGGNTQIETFVQNIQVPQTHGSAPSFQTYEEAKSSTKGLFQEFWQSFLGGERQTGKNMQVSVGSNQDIKPDEGRIPDIIEQIGIWIIILIAGIIIFKGLRRIFEIVYDMTNANRMIYLRVILPRGDSKSDREKEKEIAKDMKEKIGRMSQVYRSIHKLGELSFWDTIMDKLFNKPRISLMLHYENGLMNFIVGIYPEYQNIVEGAISAQYSESTIETTSKPTLYRHKYIDVFPMEPKKDPIFPIRTYKQLEDDPLNNIIDTISKINSEDTFIIQYNIKPEGNRFNRKALKWSEGLYRNDKKFVNPSKRYSALNPFNIFKLFKKKKSDDPGYVGPVEGGREMVRMTKSREEALNIMGEEAGKNAFKASVLLASGSNDATRLKENMRNIASTFVVYKDEYNNELDHNQMIADMFEWILEPLWEIALKFHLIGFFFKKNIFSENALASLFHLPDGYYNRSPIIKWMDYKVLAAPDNLPQLTQDSGYIVSGTIAEGFKKGVISDLFADTNHWAVGSTIDETTEIIPYNPQIHTDIDPSTITTAEDGTQTVTIKKSKKRVGLKVFKDGSLIGVNVHRNRFTPVYMKRKDRTRHHYIIGKSGGGKSVLLEFLARQDAWNGDGFCVIDPHGDLVESILNYIPASRARDVIYFNAGDEERPMGLNLYHINNINEADRVVGDATQMFLKLFGPEVFGPRLQEYFKFGSLTLLEDFDDPPTLLDVPRLYTDEAFREYKVSKVKNAVVRNFWEKTYASMGDREKEEIIPYLTAKFVDFSTNRIIRNIIGQTNSILNFRQCMDEGKILLVNLSKGKIGEKSAKLLGMIIVAQIANGAMSRANIPEEERRDFYLYVDEFQNFVTNTFADILSEARKYKLSLIMAHQYIGQLDGGAAENIGDTTGGKGGVKDAVFGNVGTMQSFKVGAPDAEFLEKEYAPVLTAQDIIGISNFKTYLKLNINNATSRVFSIDSIRSQDYKNPKVANILKEYSSKKFGRKREFVEAEISARLGMIPDDIEDEFGFDTTSDFAITDSEDMNNKPVYANDNTENYPQYEDTETEMFYDEEDSSKNIGNEDLEINQSSSHNDGIINSDLENNGTTEGADLGNEIITDEYINHEILQNDIEGDNIQNLNEQSIETQDINNNDGTDHEQ